MALKKKAGKDNISLIANYAILEKYGDANIAMFYQNIRYWIAHNTTNNTNFNNGKHWTYNSVEAFAVQFPFWSAKQIRTMLDKLIRDGYLITGNYNKMKADRTIWYALGSTKI